MAMFNFPVTYEQFKSAIKSDEVFRKVANTVPGEPTLQYIYSCLKLGWTNKQHHKAKQERDRAIIKAVKEQEKAKLATTMRQQERQKGV